jgi:hypothetical protein
VGLARGSDAECRMVGRVGKGAEGGGDRGHLAVAGGVGRDERSAVGDGYLDDADLLDVSAAGRPAAARGAQVVAEAVDWSTGETFSRRLTPAAAEVLAWVSQLPGAVAVTYEAGPTGFGLARAFAAAGQHMLGRQGPRWQRVTEFSSPTPSQGICRPQWLTWSTRPGSGPWWHARCRPRACATPVTRPPATHSGGAGG